MRYANKEDRWSKSKVLETVGTPWQPVPGRPEDAVPVRVRFSESSDEPTKPVEEGMRQEPTRRRTRITREDVKKFGYSLNCPGCRAISRGAPAENHTEACRTRIEAELVKEGGTKARQVQGIYMNRRIRRHVIEA